MAKPFVRQLPRIPSYALPSDAICLICFQQYENLTTDSGTWEKAVALPCSDKHIFGSECLLAWLTCWKTCPLCRRMMALPEAPNMQIAERDRMVKLKMFATVGDQEWDEYWYGFFWILHLHGDRAVESGWHQFRQDWILAAEEECDQGCLAQAKAALSLSPLVPTHQFNTNHIKNSARAIQTLRFREYRLFLRFQAVAGEHPELSAPPGFQLTPAQENKLFQELDRRQAFEQVFARMPRVSKRERWNMLRDVGFVWDPDWDISWANFPGRWSQYAY